MKDYIVKTTRSLRAEWNSRNALYSLRKGFQVVYLFDCIKNTGAVDDLPKAPFRSVDENYQVFKISINDSIRNHIPQKNISGRWNVPWLTTSIKRLTRKKQRLYNKARRTNNPSDWKKFKELRKHIKKQLSVAHNEYVSKMLSAPEESSPSKPVPTKRFWSCIKSKKSHDVGVAPLKVKKRSR